MATTRRSRNYTRRHGVKTGSGKGGRQDLLTAYLKTAIAVAVIVVVIAVIWLIVKPFRLRAERAKLESVVSESEALEITVDPEKEDGSGEAGRAKIPDGMHVKYDTPGWQHDDNGWWYASDETTFYVNGWFTADQKEYHFNNTGYMDTGWTPIGGRGCYFDENGVYDSSADSSHMIALTFDDGPGELTGDVLDVLEANNAKATFFMLGEMVEEYGADVIPRMVRLGCQLGNHSYDHSDMTTLTVSDALQQFQDTDAAIAKYSGGVPASVIRFPYGSYNDAIRTKIDKPSIFWDFDTLDWQQPEASSLAEYVASDAEGGNIILMHDIHANTVEAVKMMVPKLREAGYQMVTLEELAAARGYELHPTVTYFGFTDTLIANDSVSDEKRNAQAGDEADAGAAGTDETTGDQNNTENTESTESTATDTNSDAESGDTRDEVTGDEETATDETGGTDENYDESSYDESEDYDESYDENYDDSYDEDY